MDDLMKQQLDAQRNQQMWQQQQEAAERNRQMFLQQQDAANRNRDTTLYWQNFYGRMDKETHEMLRRQEELRQQQAAAQYHQSYSPIEQPQQDARRYEAEHHGALHNDVILQVEQRQQELDSLLKDESTRTDILDQQLRAEREREEYFQQQERDTSNRENTFYWQNFYKRLDKEAEEALRLQGESRQQELDKMLQDALVRQEERQTQQMQGDLIRQQEKQVSDRPGIGESLIDPEKRSGLNVDLAMQEHRQAREYRAGTGKVAQSAHMVPTSVVEDFESYSRSQALTALLPSEVHKQFDDHWKAWSRKKVAENVYEVTVEEFLKVLDEAAQSVQELRGRTADTMHWVFEQEFYQTLGLEPSTLVRVPYSPRTTG